MRKLATAAAGILAFALAGPMALAQEKKTDRRAGLKVLAENARVRAYELTFAPGAENRAGPASSTRVVRVLAGGTLERTYSDGSKEKVVYRTGEVRINDSSLPVSTKNIGSSNVRLYVVQMK